MVVAPLAIVESEPFSKIVGNFLVLLSHSTMGDLVVIAAVGLAGHETRK